MARSVLIIAICIGGLFGCKPRQLASEYQVSSRQPQVEAFNLLTTLRVCSNDNEVNCIIFPSAGPQSDQEIAASGSVLAHLAMLAYWDDGAAELAANMGFGRTIPIMGASTQAYLFELLHPTRPANILAFRGSEKKLNDWLYNIRIFRKAFPSVLNEPRNLVHAGFLAAYREVAPHIDAYLRGQAKVRLQNPKAPLWITGHSLGGALAVVSALELSDTYRGKVATGVVTFGAPRLLNNSLRSLFEQNAYGRNTSGGNAAFSDFYLRYVYGDDLVTRIPPVCLGYRHANWAAQYSKSCDVEYVPQDKICEQQQSNADATESPPRTGFFSKLMQPFRNVRERLANLDARMQQLFDNFKSQWQVRRPGLCSIKDHCYVNYAQCTLQSLKMHSR